MKKLPAFQFYPGDWRKDPGIQSLDYETRGIWFEMILFMHESERRGLLLLNGAAPDEEALARMLGIGSSKMRELKAKLLASGVASIELKTGAIMNRRMFNLHEVRSKAGSIGGSKAQAKLKQTFKQNIRPSSSSSTSSSKDLKDKRLGAFAPPSQEEVRSYMKNDLEAAKFFDYFTANGWRAGRNPMKNWQAASRNWIRQSQQRSGFNNHSAKHLEQSRRQVNTFPGGSEELKRLAKQVAESQERR